MSMPLKRLGGVWVGEGEHRSGVRTVRSRCRTGPISESRSGDGDLTSGRRSRSGVASANRTSRSLADPRSGLGGLTSWVGGEG